MGPALGHGYQSPGLLVVTLQARTWSDAAVKIGGAMSLSV